MIKQGNEERRNLVGAGIALTLFALAFIVLPKIVTRQEEKMRHKEWRIKR